MENRRTVAMISEATKDNIIGIKMPNGVFYNPRQLDDGTWIISLIEAENLPVEQLTLIDFYIDSENETDQD